MTKCLNQLQQLYYILQSYFYLNARYCYPSTTEWQQLSPVKLIDALSKFHRKLIIIYKQMNHYVKSRTSKINCEGSSKDLKKLEDMFPLYTINNSEITQALEKHFDQADPQHCRFLQQACFKTPIASSAKAYEEFRVLKCSNVTEPQISSYFSNQSFVSLKDLEKWLDGQGSYPSPVGADHMNEEMADTLLNISQQFGYIPNLERFLLYFPSYLLKVQKFKSRFFQQFIEETEEVTHLSPKNCCFAGLIAAIEIGCPYMIARMVNMFLVRDGNPNWITDRKYPEQFKPLFGLFRKISTMPWSLNQNDLNFSKSTWGKEVYFDLVIVGMFVISQSTICLALGLNVDEPCKYIPLEDLLNLKKQYDSEKYEKFANRNEIAAELSELINQVPSPSREKIQQIQNKQIEPYMKEIGAKLSMYGLYHEFGKLFQFFGIPQRQSLNIKAKDNSFFHRYRDIIDKGLEQQRKSDKIEDTKFECFKSYCLQGAGMTFSIFDKNYENMRIFRYWIEVLTYLLCGYHNECFDYKKNIKLNTDLTMPLKFYVRLLSISPLYINRQVLEEVGHHNKGEKLQCLELGQLAIIVAESKAKLLMSSIQFQLFG